VIFLSFFSLIKKTNSDLGHADDQLHPLEIFFAVQCHVGEQNSHVGRTNFTYILD